MSIKEIGCCGAYCKTCIAFKEHTCKGCKIGYNNGSRDILKAKCVMKVCCVNRELQSCADCCEYSTCEMLNNFYSKNGYKYGKYKQAIDFIRKNGYDVFIEIADKWSNAYGKY